MTGSIIESGNSDSFETLFPVSEICKIINLHTKNSELMITQNGLSTNVTIFYCLLFQCLSCHCKILFVFQLLEAEVKYHEQALDIISHILPKMKETLNCSPVKPVYGMPLEEHLRVTNRDIAQVLEACICYLLETGLEEEVLVT